MINSLFHLMGAHMRLSLLFLATVFWTWAVANAEGKVVRLTPGKGGLLATAVQDAGHPCPEVKLYQTIQTEEDYRVSRVWCGPNDNRLVDLDMDYRLTRIFDSGPDLMYVKPWED